MHHTEEQKQQEPRYARQCRVRHYIFTSALRISSSLSIFLLAASIFSNASSSFFRASASRCACWRRSSSCNEQEAQQPQVLAFYVQCANIKEGVVLTTRYSHLYFDYFGR